MSDEASEYTPTLYRLRLGWCRVRSQDGVGIPEAMAEFDRWFVAHGAEVERRTAERAWDEGHADGYSDARAHLIGDPGQVMTPNPYGPWPHKGEADIALKGDTP